MSGEVNFNDAFFAEIGKSAKVTNLCLEVANKVLTKAQADAPKETRDYVNGLQIKVVERKFRNAVLVVGTDWKTLIIEAKTGNLARSLQAVKKSG